MDKKITIDNKTNHNLKYPINTKKGKIKKSQKTIILNINKREQKNNINIKRLNKAK